MVVPTKSLGVRDLHMSITLFLVYLLVGRS